MLEGLEGKSKVKKTTKSMMKSYILGSKPFQRSIPALFPAEEADTSPQYDSNILAWGPGISFLGCLRVCCCLY